MPLGPDIAEWRELRKRLAALARSVGAHNAYVLDTRGNLWCSGHTVGWGDETSAIDIVRDELTRVPKPLPQGGVIDRRGDTHWGETYLRSFAGVYILLLRFAGILDLPVVRAAVQESLPALELLVIALPPPDGPGSGSAEGFGVA